METGVTKPIEEAVNTVSGIDELRSTTKEGVSQVVVAVRAREERRRRGAGGRRQGPHDPQPAARGHRPADRRQVRPRRRAGHDDRRLGPARLPRGHRDRPQAASRRTSRRSPGVGAVVLVGGRHAGDQRHRRPGQAPKYESLSVEDVRQALVRENLELPGGRVDRGQSRGGAADARPGRAAGGLRRSSSSPTATASRSASRTSAGSRTGSRSRAASAGSGPRASRRTTSRARTPSAWSSRSSPAATRSRSSTRCKARLAEIQPTLPADIRVEVIRDQSRFIKNSIEEVKFHLLLAAVLVSLA